MKQVKHLSVTSPTKTKAQTLLEMLISTAILLLMVGFMYYAFKSGRDSYLIGETRMQRYQNARGILDMMSREISSATLIAANLYTIDFFYTIAGQELSFAAPISDQTGDWDLCEVGYKYDSGEIKRWFDVNPDFDWTTGGSWVSLGLNVEYLAFEFIDASGISAPSWDSRPSASNEGELPAAVKITLRVRDDDAQADPQTFSTTVYLPNAE